MKTLIFEAHLTDHHKLIHTMLRSRFAKGKPLTCRIFYNDDEKFQEELKKQLLPVSDIECFSETENCEKK